MREVDVDEENGRLSRYAYSFAERLVTGTLSLTIAVGELVPRIGKSGASMLTEEQRPTAGKIATAAALALGIVALVVGSRGGVARSVFSTLIGR